MNEQMTKVKDDQHGKSRRRFYRIVSATLSIVFAVVGMIFLSVPDQVLSFFNAVSHDYGLPASPTEGIGFFLILAVAYMYVVSLLAFMMYRHPENSSFPLILVNAKLASSMISIFVVVFHDHCLIYIVNAITDGLIALGVFLLYRMIRERST